jgi:hypothetical protein
MSCREKSGDAGAKRETVVPHSAFKMSEQLVFGDQGVSDCSPWSDDLKLRERFERSGVFVPAHGAG